MSKFVRPTETSRLAAIGLIKVESDQEKYIWKTNTKDNPDKFPPVKYFFPEGFELLQKPKRGDWLTEHKEPGQPFARFITGPRTHPLPRSNIIYIQPLVFNTGEDISFEIISTLCEYANIFFGLPVKELNPVKDLDGKKQFKTVSRRINEYTNEPQINASEMMDFLKGIKPKDAFCIAGMTLCDIYPREEWHFAFGLASTENGTGVYSLARYLPETNERPMILRAIRVMCHEICHMFGIKHCIYYSCLMNGANHEDEAMSRPTFLCPSCLRKLHFMVGFDIRYRYGKMLEFWEQISLKGRKSNTFSEDIAWLNTRVSL